MVQAYLQLRGRSSAHSQMAAFKEVNGQLVQIGADFGTEMPNTTANLIKSQNNRIVNWEDDVYVVGVSGVWKFDVSTNGPWALAHTFINRHTDSVAESMRLGLIPASLNGAPRLVTAYPTPTSTNTFSVVTITPTGNFESGDITLTGASHTASTNHGFNQGIQYRNNIVWTYRGSLVELDLETNSVSQATVANYSAAGSAICVFRDSLFFCRPESANWQIRRKDGSTATFIATLPGVGNAGGSNQAAMFPFGNDHIIVLAYRDGNGGGPEGATAYAMEFPGTSTSSPNITDISAEVIPVAIRTGLGSPGRDGAWSVVIDPISNGLANPQYRAEFSINNLEGTSINLYDYTPISGALMTLIAASMDTFRYHRNYAVDGTGGQHIWPGSGTLNISAPTLSISGPNILAQYEIFGGDFTLNNSVAMQLVYDKQGEHTLSVGTLNFTSAGALSGIVAVTGLSPGDVFTVGWTAAADGISNVDNPKVGARVFVP